MIGLRWKDKVKSDMGNGVGSNVWLVSATELPSSFLGVASWVAAQQQILPQGTGEEENRKNYTVCNSNKSLRIYDLILAQHH